MKREIDVLSSECKSFINSYQKSCMGGAKTHILPFLS